MFSVGLLQVFLLSFSFIRYVPPSGFHIFCEFVNWKTPDSLPRNYNGHALSLTTRTEISLFLFVLTLMVFAAQTWATVCKKLSPIK